MFGAGETSRTVYFDSKDDLVEGDETFTLTLSASGADSVPRISGVHGHHHDDDAVLPPIARLQTRRLRGEVFTSDPAGRAMSTSPMTSPSPGPMALPSRALTSLLPAPPSASWLVKSQS